MTSRCDIATTLCKLDVSFIIKSLYLIMKWISFVIKSHIIGKTIPYMIPLDKPKALIEQPQTHDA